MGTDMIQLRHCDTTTATTAMTWIEGKKFPTQREKPECNFSGFQFLGQYFLGSSWKNNGKVHHLAFAVNALA